MSEKFRPSHADYTYQAKYGIRAWEGGGRASARETIGRVAAGAIARKWLAMTFGVEIVAWVSQVHEIEAAVDASKVGRSDVEAHITRCPDPEAAARMEAAIDAARKAGDSLGGVVAAVARRVPAGWGEPVFDKLRADLGKALFSLPAVLGVEFGQGFGVASARGSEHSDTFVPASESSIVHAPGKIATQTNRHGGMLGGISTGMPIVVRCAVKPTSSIPKQRPTVDVDGEPTTIATKGRHDPCLLPRFVPMGEAMVALVLADHALRQAAQRRF
jgi:chorismate synthase